MKGNSMEPKKDIVIDLTRLRMRDYAEFEQYQGQKIPLDFQIRILARATGESQDTIWDLNLEDFSMLARKLDEAMNNIVKKANAGS
jgi:hypothetical protein